MAGTPEMQEHFPAGAYLRTIPKNEVPLRGIRWYAGNAGAFSGGCLNGTTPQNEG